MNDNINMDSTIAGSMIGHIYNIIDNSNIVSFDRCNIHTMYYTSIIPVYIILQVIAILAAVTEVIKLNGGKETETEYFAALVIYIFIKIDN